MKILIEIECDNEAFSENTGLEISNILQSVSAKFSNYDYSVKEMDGVNLRDSNGNKVGTVKVKG